MYEKVYATHKPLTEAASHTILNRIVKEIDKGHKGLAFDVQGLEKLEPKKLGAEKYDGSEANTEYPFLTLSVDASESKYTVLQSFALYFSGSKSLELYRLAQELLTLLPTLYPVIAGWSITLPPAL